MIKRGKIGFLIHGKKLKASRREFVAAAEILDKGEFKAVIFGRKRGKVKSTIARAKLTFEKLDVIEGRQDFNASLKFTQVLKKKKIFTIIFRDPRSTNLLVTAKYLMKGKLRLVFVQDRHLTEMHSDFLYTFRFNQIDAWITPITQTANYVKSGTNLALDKIHVLPLPIPRKPFQFEKEEQKLRKSVLFSDPEAVAVGWNVPKEHNLIQRTGVVLLQMLRSTDGLRVCLNLKHPLPDYLFTEIPELKEFEERIKTTPFDPLDADMYAHLDALFIDPEKEPFAGITRRALMSGVVPIAPKSLITDELLENGRLGLIYTGRDNNDVFAKLSDRALLQEFQSAGRKYMGTNFTKKRFRENLEALIHSLPEKSTAR